MNTQGSGTRQRIKDTALRLFSQKGFTAVSIRDLCGEVGIKESTVYYYFKNKQSIFDEFLADFKAVTAAVAQSFGSAFSKITTLDEKAFVQVGLQFLNHYLRNDEITRFFRMLSIEQHVNADAAALLHQALFEEPLAHNERVFGVMAATGLFKAGDAREMAMEYYAPILLLYLRFFSTGEATEQAEREAESLLCAHLTNFYKRYAANREGD